MPRLRAAPMTTYYVTSDTDATRTYRVDLSADGSAGVCDCPATAHTCKHIERVRKATSMTETAVIPSTSPLVVQPPPTALLPSRDDISLMLAIAETAVKAQGMVPQNIKTKEQAVAIMMAGWELGLRPMTALRHVYVVNGRTELETRAMMGVIRAKEPAIQFAVPEYTNDAVTVVMTRPGQEPTAVRYTAEDAKRSGQLSKGGPWQSYTRDMLFAAAGKRACRIGAPDLINAIDTAMVAVAAVPADIAPAPISVRVVDDPAEAVNSGDDGALPPEVAAATAEAADPVALRAEIVRLILRLRDETDADFYQRALVTVRERWGHAHNERGKLMPSKLTDGEADALRAYLSEALDGSRP